MQIQDIYQFVIKSIKNLFSKTIRRKRILFRACTSYCREKDNTALPQYILPQLEKNSQALLSPRPRGIEADRSQTTCFSLWERSQIFCEYDCYVHGEKQCAIFLSCSSPSLHHIGIVQLIAAVHQVLLDYFYNLLTVYPIGLDYFYNFL